MIPISYNLRNLAVRKSTTSAAVLGLALVVFVFAAVQMLANSLTRTLARSASPDVGVVLRQGATSEMESSIETANVALVLNDRAVANEAGGPRGVGELTLVVLLEKEGAQGVSNVQIRGVTPDSRAFRPGIKIIEGRAPTPGTDEAMVGRAIRGRFKGLELNQAFELKKNRLVRVVGVFEDGGSSAESEIWADLQAVRTAFGRETMVSAIRARLPPSHFDAFKTSVESNRQLNLQVMKEAEYYEKQSENTAIFIRALGTLIAVLFSIGAMLGAMITMHGTVANRQREIGTLRALGFGKGTILLSFLIESAIVALAGGAIGVAASLALGLVRFSMINTASWSEIVFGFEPNLPIMLGALIFATVVGVAGGLFPAVRAARVSPIDALRA